MKFLLTLSLIFFPVFVFSQSDLPSLKPLQTGNKAGWFSRMDGEFIVEIPSDVTVSNYRVDNYGSRPEFGKCPTKIWWTKPASKIVFMSVVFCNLTKPPQTEADKLAFLEARNAEEKKWYGNDVEAADLPELDSPGNEAVTNGYRIIRKRGAILTRHFIFRDRFYVLASAYSSTETEALALRFMNSFRFVDAEKISQMRVEAADPGELPQTPVVKKTTTDVFDERLKGRVKTVFDEAAAYENGKPGTRRMRGEMQFDSAGNILRKIVYADGAPIHIERYGFIGGKRVFKLAAIPHDNWNPPPNASAAATPPRDPRYDGSRKYNYDAQGRVAERIFYTSDGRQNNRSVYVYRQNIFTETFFDRDGKRQYAGIMTFSRKGFITKLRTKPYASKLPPVTWIFEYKSYDARGNWARRIISKPKIVGGETTLEPVSEEYRKVTYY